MGTDTEREILTVMQESTLGMRLCIPTEDDRGLSAQLSAHFGRAPYYTIVAEAGEDVDIVENESDHFGGSKRPPQFVADLDVTAVAVDELGQRSKAVFAEQDIEVYQAPAGTVANIVRAFEEDDLSPISSEDVHPSGHHRRD